MWTDVDGLTVARPCAPWSQAKKAGVSVVELVGPQKTRACVGYVACVAASRLRFFFV